MRTLPTKYLVNEMAKQRTVFPDRTRMPTLERMVYDQMFDEVVTRVGHPTEVERLIDDEKRGLKLGLCPKCFGTMREPYDNPHAYVVAGYDPETKTIECHNCGGQTMGGKATGLVPLRPNGEPCLHEYEHRLAGNCYHVYTCKHCGHKYDIDSGD